MNLEGQMVIQIAELKDQLLHALAETENLRRRVPELLKVLGVALLALNDLAEDYPGGEEGTPEYAACPFNEGGFAYVACQQIRAAINGITDVGLVHTPVEVGTTFGVDDVLTFAPSWTRGEAEEWLAVNSRYLKDRLTEVGWDVIGAQLGIYGGPIR